MKNLKLKFVLQTQKINHEQVFELVCKQLELLV